MPKITGVVTCVPKNRIDQTTAREFAKALFGMHHKDIDRLLQVFDHSGIDSRYFSKPMEWFLTPHSFAEKNNAYITSATELGAEASNLVLKQSKLTSKDIDYIIYINTTGIATPTIDARLINLLDFPKDIRRTPIWGLGCAGGAAGLSHAYHYLLGHPKDRVLLVAVELCGLTFLNDDFSKSNLVGTSLFGEGAAAIIMVGDGIGEEGPAVIGTQSRFYPDSLDVMGWNLNDRGLQVLFAKRIPSIIEETAKVDLGGFLGNHQLNLDDICVFLFHPGGTKVLEAYEKTLNIPPEKIEISRQILREYGNMSSATVLFVLERFLKSSSYRKGYGLISSLGPGFCSESLLIKF